MQVSAGVSRAEVSRRDGGSAEGKRAIVYSKLEEVLTGGLGACPMQLYSCQPTREIIQRRFREDAALRHPLFKCAGIHNITAVSFALVRTL